MSRSTNTTPEKAAPAGKSTPRVPSGYKQTEVGVIPEEWEVRQLSEHFRISAGGDVPKHSLSEIRTDLHPYPIFANALQNKGLYGYTGERRAKGGSLTITGRGYLGHAEYREEDFFPIVRLLVLEPTGELDSKFTTYAVNDRVKFAFESTGVPQLTAPQVGQYSVAAPTLAEQEAIAEALSDADVLIDSLDQLIAKKRLLKQGAMQDLLTGNHRLPGFEGEWEVKRLGDAATLKARIGWQGLTTAEYLKSGDYHLVTGTDFLNGYIDWANCHYVTAKRYQQDKNIQLRPRDVLVTKDGTIGKVAFVPEMPIPATLNSGVFVIRPVEGSFQPEFFYYLMCSQVFADFLAQLSAGSTINHLYQKDFVTFTFRIPPTLPEQTAIAAILSDMDAEIAALEAKLAKARQVKQGMMQELLTGKTRLV